MATENNQNRIPEYELTLLGEWAHSHYYVAREDGQWTDALMYHAVRFAITELLELRTEVERLRAALTLDTDE